MDEVRWMVRMTLLRKPGRQPPVHRWSPNQKPGTLSDHLRPWRWKDRLISPGASAMGTWLNQANLPYLVAEWGTARVRSRPRLKWVRKVMLLPVW